MQDLDVLKALIVADHTQRGQPISKLGYFCAPFRPKAWPFADKVIKVYRGLSDHAALHRLAACHDHYVAVLQKTGVPLPETTFHLLDLERELVPVIVQEALPGQYDARPNAAGRQRAGDHSTRGRRERDR